MSIGDFLQQATATLTQAGITTARLDVLVLLSDALDRDKSWILAHNNDELPTRTLQGLQQKITTRAARTPLAYIRGKQAFYGRDFAVTPDVLIPRPETETLIDLLKIYKPARVLDVGTGSGAVAVSAASELPNAAIDACDISQAALDIAAKNAKDLGVNVHFIASDLLQNVRGQYDAIAANLPYVSKHWQRSPETNAEPSLALFAEDDGLALIKRLLVQAPGHLNPGGYVLLEADPRQHKTIAVSPGFKHVTTDNFIIVLQKI
ncbi:MAG TPA: peptide chain release factor N(5)-glutamine methyltransferase [Candidatus Saccharimonas sp.]|nr:peptide chain release factor N(5)-glutamine methyltransferase [Candidatus Saccharimonas sp.]